MLLIDKNSLDIALEEQAHVFYQIGLKYAQICSLRDEAADTVKVIAAKKNIKIRRDAEKAKTKITEDMVKQLVNTSEDFIKGNDIYLDFKNQAEEWHNLKDAFQQRSYMLRELVQLYVSQYYSDTSISERTNPNVSNRKYESNREKMGESRRSKKREKLGRAG